MNPRSPASHLEPEISEIRAPASGLEEFAELRQELISAIKAICPAWLADRREDLVQSALINLLKHRGEHKDGFSSSYLKRVAYNALIDEIRRLRRRREIPIEDDEETEMVALRADRETPETRFHKRELGREIEECLGRLVAPRRRAVLLVLLGHSMPEVARLLGWNLKRVQNLVSRGRDDLRRCLSEKGLRP